MALEIERKFLVKDTNPLLHHPCYEIKQGYFQQSDSKVTRVRTYGNKAFLTLKAKVDQQFKTRLEFEYEIPYNDALQLLSLCDGTLIEKTRYHVSHKGKTWEVDVFEGDNKGLVVAEIELKNETESVELPYWIEEEVTEDKRYINSYLALFPFNTWENR